MNIVELLSKNADIYDALIDNHEIELVGVETVDQLIVEIDSQITCYNGLLALTVEGLDEWLEFTRAIADLCMIKGFINIITAIQYGNKAG